MQRLLLALSLLLVAGTAHAFDASRRPERIAVLRADSASLPGRESRLDRAIRETLLSELRARGFDAFDAGLTWQEARDEGIGDADFIVEFLGHDASSVDYGGVTVDGRAGGISLAVMTSRVAAEVLLYDGETMEIVAQSDLAKKNTAVVPTGVGGGVGHAVFFWVATPWIERAQIRGVARAAARDAAAFVTSTIRAAE